MRRITVVLALAFLFLSGWFRQSCAAQTNTTTDTAVSALIKYSNPRIAQTNIKSSNLTTAQISAVKSSLSKLAGKKFIILNGRVVVLDRYAITDITNVKDILYLQITRGGSIQGKAILADLTWLNAKNVCNTNTSWYTYLNCMLDNLAKDSPGTAIGDDPLLQNSIKSYLDRRYAAIGGSEANFDITAKGISVDISPKPVNNLQGLEKSVSVLFENDPLVYDKKAIQQFFKAFLTDTSNTDVFYVVVDNALDVLSIYGINDIINPAQPSPSKKVGLSTVKKTTADSFPEEPTCYEGQSGSVLPCNNQIDWVTGNLSIRVVERGMAPEEPWNSSSLKAEIMPLEKLGYKIKSIEASSYPKDGVAFLKDIVKAKGQVLLLNFNGSTSNKDRFKSDFGLDDGCIGAIGLVEEKDAGPGGSFERALANDPEFISLFKKSPFPTAGTAQPWQSSLRWLIHGLMSFPPHPPRDYFGWRIRINDLKIPQKAIESGYTERISGGLENARSIYLPRPYFNWAYQFAGWYDLKLFTNYMLGYGPTGLRFEQYRKPVIYTNHYDKYPPDFAGPNNNVSNIMDFGGPSKFTENPPYNLPRYGPPLGVDYPTPVLNSYGQLVFVNVPYVMESKIQVSDVHLFPYIKDFRLFNEDESFEEGDTLVKFSDDIGKPPTLDFKIKGKNAIRTGPNRYPGKPERAFTFSLIPEVEVVKYQDYYTAVGQGKDQHIPKPIFTIKDARAAVNDIEMVGNPLAFHTAEDKYISKAPVPFFKYNPVFWHYNARALGDDIHTFKAAIPVKLHPYVEALSVEGNQAVIIKFSLTASNTEPLPSSVDASNLLTVDCSACGKQVFTEGGSPKLINGNTLTFQLDWSKDGLYVYPSSASLTGWQKTAVKVKVRGFKSPWNQFPLLGNTYSSSKWLHDMNGNTIADWKEGNSDQFPQKEGDFEVWIPCMPQTPPAPLTTASQPVIWKDAVGVKVTGNSLTKTTALAWGNSGAASRQVINGSGAVEFQGADAANNVAMCGFSNSNKDANYNTIGYALYMRYGKLWVYENGDSRGILNSYTASDILSVERKGSNIYYKKNGITFYASAIPSRGALVADTALYNRGANILNAKIKGGLSPNTSLNSK